MNKKEQEQPTLTPKEALKEISQVPLADVLVHAFGQYSDPDSWQMVNSIYGPKINGSAKSLQDEYDRRYLTLEKFYKDARLKIHLYRSDFEDESPWGDLNITAGIKQTGTWAAGLGNQQTFGINVWFSRHGGFYLPTKGSRWVFEIAANVAKIASELHDPISDQPRFWDRKGVEET